MFRLFADLIARNLEAGRKLAATESALVEERAVAELREEFIAVLGHDLSNPTRAIRCLAELLQPATMKIVPGGGATAIKGVMEMRAATALLLFASVTSAVSQELKTAEPQTIPLTVPAGVPLRLYLTKRVSKRLDAAVEARFAGPVYAFDREVIPSGTQATGHVSRLLPVSK